MSEWKRSDKGFYHRTETKVEGVVFADGERWISLVSVEKERVDQGEWDSHSDALINADTAMHRACWLRRFDDKPPSIEPTEAEIRHFEEGDE